jgi:hypothetical protein
VSDIHRLAMDVNDVLGHYIQIHDRIVKFSLRKIIPIPGLFKPIEYCRYEQELATLCSQLATRQADIAEAIKLETPVGDEADFLATLAKYSAALMETLERLRSICAELCRKSENSGVYEFDKYKVDMQHYQESVDHYMRSEHV